MSELYSTRKHSPYFYIYGFSWHAYAAYIAGILVNIVGFVGAVGVSVPIGAVYLYNVNFFGGFFSSLGVYYLITRLSPIPGASDTWNEVNIDVTGFSIGNDNDSRHSSADGRITLSVGQNEFKQDYENGPSHV